MTRLPLLQLLTASTEDTLEIAGAIAKLARQGDVIVLSGEMGSGKTVFAQGFGREMGIDEPITSPTFTLVHSYDSGRIVLHHADLYRLNRVGEAIDLALGELVEGGGILLVEWGEAASEVLGDHLEVVFERSPDGADDSGADQRWLTIQSVGTVWDARWPRLEAALAVWSGVR